MCLNEIPRAESAPHVSDNLRHLARLQTPGAIVDTCGPMIAVDEPIIAVG